MDSTIIDGQAVLCPPDQSIAVDWLNLKRALKEEVAANLTDAKTQQAFSDVLQLVELITLLQFAEDSRYVQAAMRHSSPELTAAEQQLLATTRSSFGDAPVDEQQLEQEVLETIIKLLLRARYSPLTQTEWELAQADFFTFDIPVSMDLSGLDGKLLANFWDRQAQRYRREQQQQQQTQHALQGVRLTASDSNQPAHLQPACQTRQSGAHIQQQYHHHTAATAMASKPTIQSAPRRLQDQPASAALLDPSQLPDFSNRLLVFHRGVGVATAPGLYLTQKLDMLLDYLLLEPFNGLMGRLSQVVQGPAQQLKQQQQSDLQQQRQPQDEGWPWKDGFTGISSPKPGSSSSTKSSEARVLAGSGNLDHPAARVVVRRSLRSLMPGPAQVVARFWEPLVLQEPTYRSVVVLYRTAPPEAAAASGTANMLESLLGVALLAMANDWLAMDAAVEAAQTAAAVKSRAAASVDSEGEEQTEEQLQPRGQSASSQERSTTSTEVRHNPLNIVLKSFADVALADMELVMPAKQVQMQPTTVIRTALTALGAVGAALALYQQRLLLQETAAHWSLVLLPAVGLVVLRAVKVLTTIKTHQASLTSTMLSMAYNAARDSQEGVLCKLVDELRDSNTKEAALAVTALLLNCWQHQQTPPQEQQQQQEQLGTAAGAAAAAVRTADTPKAAVSSGNSAVASINSGSSWQSFTKSEVDMASEAFLQRRFGIQVDFTLNDTLALLVQWGIVTDTTDGYQLRSLPEAVRRLKAQSLLQRVMRVQSDPAGSSPTEEEKGEAVGLATAAVPPAHAQQAAPAAGAANCKGRLQPSALRHSCLPAVLLPLSVCVRRPCGPPGLLCPRALKHTYCSAGMAAGGRSLWL